MRKGMSLLTAVAMLTGCGSENAIYTSEGAGAELSETDASFSSECTVTFGEAVSIQGAGAWFENGCLSLTEGGIYNLSGTLEDGMIYIDSNEPVRLVLNGISVENPDGAAVFCKRGELSVEAAEGTENFFADGDYSYKRSFESSVEKIPNAAFFTGDKLKFCGEGSITVTSGSKTGVFSEKELFIADCALSVSAEKSGIKSGSGIFAENAVIDVKSAGDCVKTDGERTGRVELVSSDVRLASEQDGIQADGLLTLSGGTLTVKTTGDTENDPDLSSKGIKAGELFVSDCAVKIDSTDHAVRTDGAATVDSGSLTLNSVCGKGISAKGELNINGGEICILNSTEGLESKSALNINGGRTSIISTDDGINAGGEDGCAISINGGSVYIDAAGDGLDSNGDINVTGGTVVVFGPVSDRDGALDCGDNGNSINVSGGLLLALGSTGMMKTPEKNFLGSTSLNAAAGDTVTIADSAGNIVISALLPKTARGVVFGGGADCSELRIIKGGTLSGTRDALGLLTDGTISGGEAAAQVFFG